MNRVRKERFMVRSSRIAFGVLALVGGFALTACNSPSMVGVNYPHARSATLAESGDEHYQRVSRGAERDRLLLQEDLDLLFQTERPTRLTRWHVK